MSSLLINALVINIFNFMILKEIGRIRLKQLQDDLKEKEVTAI